MIDSAGGVVGGAEDEKHRLMTRSHIRNPISRPVFFACTPPVGVFIQGDAIVMGAIVADAIVMAYDQVGCHH